LQLVPIFLNKKSDITHFQVLKNNSIISDILGIGSSTS